MATRDRIVDALDSLDGWLTRLPGPAREAVGLAVAPLRTVLLDLPDPALAVVGGSRDDRVLLGALFAGEANAPWSLGDDGWWHVEGPRGVLRIADLDDVPDPSVDAAAPLDRVPPDALLVLPGADPASLATLHELLTTRHGRSIPVVGVLGGAAPQGGIARVVEQRAWRHALEDGGLAGVEVFDPSAREGEDDLVRAVVEALPDGPSLAVLRLAGRESLLEDRARELVRSASAAASAVAASPLPVADSVPLAALQLVLVLGVARLAGRPADLTSARELLGAAGVQLGGAMAFRETARALVKLLPGWGSAISAGIAWTGTAAVGEAAIAWFIHDMPQSAVRGLLSRTPDDDGDAS